MKEFSSIYASADIESITKRHNCSGEEALKIQQERVTKTKEAFAKKSDDEIKRINKSKSCTLESLISKHGVEEGTKIYNDRITKFKETTSMENLIKLHGEEEAQRIRENRRKASSSSLPTLIEKFGEKEGTQRYENQIKRKAHSQTIQGYIDRYGFDEGVSRFNLRQEKFKESWSNMDPTEIERIRKIQGASYDTMCEMYGIEKGSRIYKERRSIKGGKASLASMRVFDPVINHLLSIGFTTDDIIVGTRGNNEMFIEDVDNHRFYFYDFCIPSLKFIVEYNGITFHPKSPDCEWSNPYNPGISAKDAYEIDKYKRMLAESHGYEVMVIWEDEPLAENVKKVINRIRELMDQVEVKDTNK